MFWGEKQLCFVPDSREQRPIKLLAETQPCIGWHGNSQKTDESCFILNANNYQAHIA